MFKSLLLKEDGDGASQTSTGKEFQRSGARFEKDTRPALHRSRNLFVYHCGSVYKVWGLHPQPPPSPQCNQDKQELFLELFGTSSTSPS